MGVKMARRSSMKSKARNTASNSKAARKLPVQLSHPYSAQALYSADKIAGIHDAALRVLQELGIQVLLEEARDILANHGAGVKGDMVFIGADMVQEALRTAPSEMSLKAPNPDNDLRYANGQMLFGPGGGCPNVYDRLRGRRPGDAASFIELCKLVQQSDVLHFQPVSPEPQDIATHERHLFMLETQLAYGDKPLIVYARGRAQAEQLFEATSMAMDIGSADFSDQIWLTTVINSNSPRLLDIPMAQGIIDFARFGQLSIITPFCLAGAMAPITIEGALTLQHAEALAAITLAQMTRAGAPISYGGFSSNVDMRSGSPAFGTPEHIQLQIGSGQLARHIGLPWRSAAGSAANLADAQGASENLMALWGGLMGQASLILHATGWLEGGLTLGYEKMICDLDSLQMLAYLAANPVPEDPDYGFSAIAEVAPGGHFFATSQTMARYADAFHTPLNRDLNNHGSWMAAGGQSAEVRATEIWQDMLARYQPPAGAQERLARISNITAGFRSKGGAEPA